MLMDPFSIFSGLVGASSLSNPSNLTVGRTCVVQLTLDILDRTYVTFITPERKCFDLATLEALTISEVLANGCVIKRTICNVNFLKPELLYCTVALWKREREKSQEQFVSAGQKKKISIEIYFTFYKSVIWRISEGSLISSFFFFYKEAVISILH